MPSWPDPAWFDEVCAAAAGMGSGPLDAVVAVEVSGGPGGGAEHWVVRGGHLEEGGPGAPAAADLTCAVAVADLLSMHRGSLDPAVAFMQGRLKISGDPGRVVDVVSLAHSLAAAGRG